MKTFPREYCIRTEWLDEDIVVKLFDKLKKEGCRTAEDPLNFDSWAYLGRTEYGELAFYDQAYSYIGLDSDIEHNVLSIEWLEEYLGEGHD